LQQAHLEKMQAPMMVHGGKEEKGMSFLETMIAKSEESKNESEDAMC